jgi:transcriptional regulator
MYIPAHFQSDDTVAAVAFMQRYNFASLVTVLDLVPVASHLPFAIEAYDLDVEMLDRAPRIQLLGHMARANPQWQHIEGQQVLVIFTEPHAYISPSLYEKVQNVPTWNYVAVHAYGKAKLIQDDAAALALLEKQIHVFESGYAAQWSGLSDDYKKAMVKGIVAFEIEVERLEFKRKLSQNKSDRDRQTVKAHLEQSEDGMLRDLGQMMD